MSVFLLRDPAYTFRLFTIAESMIIAWCILLPDGGNTERKSNGWQPVMAVCIYRISSIYVFAATCHIGGHQKAPVVFLGVCFLLHFAPSTVSIVVIWWIFSTKLNENCYIIIAIIEGKADTGTERNWSYNSRSPGNILSEEEAQVWAEVSVINRLIEIAAPRLFLMILLILCHRTIMCQRLFIPLANHSSRFGSKFCVEGAVARWLFSLFVPRNSFVAGITEAWPLLFISSVVFVEVLRLP